MIIARLLFPLDNQWHHRSAFLRCRLLVLILRRESHSVDEAEQVILVSPSPAPIADRKAFNQKSCLVSLRPRRKGDGAVGLTLNPRPADLSYHAQPGVHTDGQLFDWISNGFPGSVMPAFNDKLTKPQRWDLVNFIRTLAAK